MKIGLLLTIATILSSGAFAKGFGVNSKPGHCDWPDTAENVVPQDDSKPPHWINIDLMLGRQSFNGGWTPYSLATFLAMSSQLRFGRSCLWLDGSIVVAWAGETDADGHRAGPGTSFVELHNGIGHWWYFDHSSFSFYAGGGLTYAWAKLVLPDRSRPPLPISEFLGYSVYPEKEADGHFWGGYLRGGIVYHTNEKWYCGVGVLGTLTTKRMMLNRMINVNSFIIGFFVGAGD